MAEETNTTTTQQPAAQNAQGGTQQAATTTPAAQTTQAATAEPEKKFTQDDLDDAVEKRLARERRKWEREQKSQPAAQQPAAQSTAGAAPAATQQPAAAAASPAVPDETVKQLAAANARQVRLAAKLTAVELGVPATRVEYAARMADLSKVDVDEVDGPDTDAIKKAVTQVLKDIPELKGPAQSTEGGQKPGIKVGADNNTQKPTTAAQAPASTQAMRVKPWNKFRTRNF